MANEFGDAISEAVRRFHRALTEGYFEDVYDAHRDETVDERQAALPAMAVVDPAGTVYEHDSVSVCNIHPDDRQLLADVMIERWRAFARGEGANEYRPRQHPVGDPRKVWRPASTWSFGEPLELGDGHRMLQVGDKVLLTDQSDADLEGTGVVEAILKRGDK